MRRLRIDADADTDCFFIFSHLCTFPAHFFIFLILCKGIEDDMVADLHQFFHIFFFVCRCKRRDVSSPMIGSLRLVQNTGSTGKSAAQLIADEKCSAALDDTGEYRRGSIFRFGK